MWTRPRRVCNLGLSWGAQPALGSIYTSLHVAHVRRWVSRSCSKAREDLGSLRAQCTVGAEAGECASGDRLRGRGSSQSQTQMRIRLVTNGRSGPRPHARPAQLPPYRTSRPPPRPAPCAASCPRCPSRPRPPRASPAKRAARAPGRDAVSAVRRRVPASESYQLPSIALIAPPGPAPSPQRTSVPDERPTLTYTRTGTPRPIPVHGAICP